MAYVSVYEITSRGVVRHIDDVAGAGAGASYIWDALGKKYLGRDFHIYNDAQAEALWQLPRTGRMTPFEDAVMRFTFDTSWVAKADILRLAADMAAFWEVYRHFTRDDGTVGEIRDTIPRLRALIAEQAGRKGIKGLCFRQVSVISNPWDGYNFNRGGRIKGLKGDRFPTNIYAEVPPKE